MQNITYSNKQSFLKTLENIKKDWISNLHILADFDNTLTRAFVNGERTPSLTSLLRWKEGALWEECAIKDEELFNIYYPIEIDSTINLDEKNIKMIEWWTKSFELFIEYWLSKDNLRKIAKNEWIRLRDWANEFLEFINKNNIPVIIISASWIWNKSISYFLEERWLMFDGIEIISNDFEWCEGWKAIAYKKPIIHSFNKSETVLKENPEIYKKIENRKNIILLWDSLGDHHMVDWFEYDNLINIWFLNHNEEKLMEEYKKRYDIVITWDGDFDIVNEILEKIK